MTELQKQIVNILNTKDFEHLTCDDIAWKLKKHKMHIGRSVKSLVEKGILEGYRPYYGGNIKYFMVNNDSLEKDKI
jgi:predicted transcriptional regulator